MILLICKSDEYIPQTLYAKETLRKLFKLYMSDITFQNSNIDYTCYLILHANKNNKYKIKIKTIISTLYVMYCSKYI